MIIPNAFGPFIVRENFIANNSPLLVTIYQPTMATPSSPINNPTIPFHPPVINGLNNPQIIFHTPPYAMANNTLTSSGAPPINTIHHAPIITPYNPPASFFCGCPLNPHQVAHGHMVSPSYSLDPEALAPPCSPVFDSSPGNNRFTLLSPHSSIRSNETSKSDPAEQDNWTMGRTVHHPPVIAPHNSPVSYFNGFPFYPPSTNGQFVTSNYWSDPAGFASRDLAYFGHDPKQHYFTRSSSPCSSTESNETSPDDLVEEDEMSMVDELIVRVNSPVEIKHKGDKLHEMDVASLSFGHGTEELSGACLIKPEKLEGLFEEDERRIVEGPTARVNSPVEVGNKEDKSHGRDVASLLVEKLARGMTQCHVTPTSKFIWPPTAQQDAYFTEVLYATSCKRRLQVFLDISSMSI